MTPSTDCNRSRWSGDRILVGRFDSNLFLPALFFHLENEPTCE